ncbi:MAG: FHIPEP family type III secretion protein, partial [Actinobacteria bacterium]|nr:FHIPEP family type III secretion protein [Actinomycetota bacterium]
RRIEALGGSELWAELEPGVPGGRLELERERLSTHLARELGLRFGHSIHFDTSAELGEREFRIVVNGLVRATGDLGPGRYGQRGEGSGETEGEVWVGPLSGLAHRRLGEALEGGFDAPERLVRHIRAAVREAAAEFADADWASAFLDRLAHIYPVTVPAVRTAAGDDLLGALLRELVTQGVGVADPRLMELIRKLVRSDELAADCRALAAAPEGHIGRTAGAMAEWLRERLRREEPDPGVPVLELGPAAEAAVRAAVGSQAGRVPVYALAEAGGILGRLEGARVRLGAAEVAVVTDAPLRRHVHRLIAAQFPTAGVIARHELDPAVPRETVDLSGE